MEITKDIYVQYAKKIVSVLDNDEFYKKFKTRVNDGVSNFKLSKKRLIQDIDITWIETIEDCLPNLDTIVRNPRKFIVQEEDIVDISLARSISTESIKHLAQHTNMISKVDKDGTVTPNKILNITKEESFEIYENRFIYTLLLKLKDFVTMRYDKIKKASATQDILELDLESRFNLPSKKITYKTNYFAQLSFDEVMQLDPDTLTKIERVAKIDRIITDFLSSSFAKAMRNSAPVRPPITRTNVILKEPNFKKALTLWQFVETYQREGGFSTSDDVEDYDITDDSKTNLYSMITLNTMLFESLYDEHETDMDMEDKDFADFANVGNMDFLADNINKDEYGQKGEEEFDKEEEEETKEVETVEAETPEDADMETKEENETPPEEPEEVEVETPEPEPVIIEVEKEKIVEVEMPPKEFMDRDPVAEDFDKYLFDVRKLYKQPKEDKLRQEEVQNAKDAIDRCLVSYRKIKQEILDIRSQEYRDKKKREEAAKRALLYKQQQEDILRDFKAEGNYFGVDPLTGKKQKKKDKIKLNKNEHLSLEDKDLENIQKQYDEMQKKSKVTYPEEEALNMNIKKEEEKIELETTDLSASEIDYTKGGIRTGNVNIDKLELNTGGDMFEVPKDTQKPEDSQPKEKKPRKKKEKKMIEIEVGHAELTKQDAKEIKNKNTYDYNLGISSINLNNPYETIGADVFGVEDKPQKTKTRKTSKRLLDQMEKEQTEKVTVVEPEEIEKKDIQTVVQEKPKRKRKVKATPNMIEIEVGHAELTKQDAKEIKNKNTYDFNLGTGSINLNNPYESIGNDIFGGEDLEPIKIHKTRKAQNTANEDKIEEKVEEPKLEEEVVAPKEEKKEENKVSKPRKPRKKKEEPKTIEIEVGHAELNKQEEKEIKNNNTYDFNIASGSINLDNPFGSLGQNVFGEKAEKEVKPEKPNKVNKKIEEKIEEKPTTEVKGEIEVEPKKATKEEKDEVEKPKKATKANKKAKEVVDTIETKDKKPKDSKKKDEKPKKETFKPKTMDFNIDNFGGDPFGGNKF